MWSVQAVAEPPNNVLSLQHGQIVITCPEMKSSPAEPAATLVGHAKTLEMCRQPDGKGTDPWLTSDPWSKAVSSVPAAPSGPPVQHVLHEFEQRLEQSILAKLPPQDKMEADDQDQRLQMLEAHFKQFSNRQTALETTVNDHHQQSTAQVQSLQQQMKVQLDVQTQQMQNMLTDQMARIETILAKKPRTEWKQEGQAFVPTARVTPGLCRPIRALLSLFLILSTFRIGEARVPGPDTWNLWICNPSGLQEKHYILSSVRADVVAISETHLSQSAKRNLELSFRSSQYISVSLQTCPHRSLFASQIDLLRRRPMEWS